MAIPTDISGLYAWYKASSYSLIDGDTCGNWIDSSGNGRTLTVSAAGGYPKFRTNQLAGYPAVDFSANGTFASSGWGWRTAMPSNTFFIVFLTRDLTSSNPMVTSTGGNAAEGPRGGSFGGLGVGKFGTIWWNSLEAYFAVGQDLTANVWHYGYTCNTFLSVIGCALDSASESTTGLSGSRHGTYPSEACQMNTDGGALWNQGLVAEWFAFPSNLSAGDKALMNEYLRNKYFSAAPGQQEQVRDVLSRRLWLRRLPTGLFEVLAPLWMLDGDILDRIALEARTGPAPAAAGWGGKKWQRRAFTIQSQEIDFSAMSVRLLLLDRRPLDVLLWDSAKTDLRNSNARQGGVARLVKGIGFTFARLSKAWIPNPADPTSIVECGQTERAINQVGEYLEEARTNLITRSSFGSGTTGLTLAGTGTNGSAIGVDTADLFFESSTTPNSLKFTAGNPNATELRITFLATASIVGNSMVALTLDHKTDSGEALYYRVQRGFDSYYLAADGTWQVGSVDLPLNSHSDRDPDDRYIKVFNVGANATVLTLSVFLQSGGTASRISHLYHAQIEVGSFPTSRIVCDGTAVTRVKTELSHGVTTGLKLYNPDLGAYLCSLMPDWSSSELGSTEDQYLYWMETNGGADHQALYYDASAGAWVFESKVGGSTVTATKTASVTRGTAVKVGARWTGADGELGLTNYTISVFVNGVKGTDATSAAPTFTSPETLFRGSDGSLTKQANGAIWDVRILPHAPTDEEMAAYP